MHLEPWQWAIGALGAFLVGISKTGIPGLGILAVALFALVFPARDSVGLVLVILICADIVAVRTYWNEASWPHLWRLLPWALAGIVIGFLALGRINDLEMRRLIGIILLILVVLQFVRSRQPAVPSDRPPARWSAPLTGIAGGFTTMVANAAGPIMMIYLLAMRLPKITFVATAAWFFFMINLAKVPFSAALGLINLASLRMSLLLAPFAVIGALIGRPIVERINQRIFELIVLALTFLAALVMLR